MYSPGNIDMRRKHKKQASCIVQSPSAATSGAVFQLESVWPYLWRQFCARASDPTSSPVGLRLRYTTLLIRIRSISQQTHEAKLGDIISLSWFSFLEPLMLLGRPVLLFSLGGYYVVVLRLSELYVNPCKSLGFHQKV